MIKINQERLIYIQENIPGPRLMPAETLFVFVVIQHGIEVNNRTVFILRSFVIVSSCFHSVFICCYESAAGINLSIIYQRNSNSSFILRSFFCSKILDQSIHHSNYKIYPRMFHGIKLLPQVPKNELVFPSPAQFHDRTCYTFFSFGTSRLHVV